MTSKQWAGIAAIVAGVAIVVYLVMPKEPHQSLQVRLVRVFPSSQEVGDNGKTAGLSADEVNELKSLGVTGTLQAFSGTSVSRGSFPTRASVVVVLTEELHSSIELREPQAAHVMYVQQGETWTQYPSGAPTVRYQIKIWPSTTRPGMIEVRSGSFHGTFSGHPPVF